jgi:hypothetical protein
MGGMATTSVAETSLTLDQMQQVPVDLFKATHVEEAQEAQHQQHVQKIHQRTQLIRNVFNTVRTQVINWFENIDDERIDK